MKLADCIKLDRTRSMKAGGPGSGRHPGFGEGTDRFALPRPDFKFKPNGGLGALNEKELVLHHALLEKAGEPNAHTAAEIAKRNDDGTLKLSPEQLKRFFKVLEGTGVVLGGVPNYSQATGGPHLPV